MKTYEGKLRLRIKIYWIVIGVLLVSMVLVGEFDGRQGSILNSRNMPDLAHDFARLVVFGGIIVFGLLIRRTKRLLTDRMKRAEAQRQEEDERRQFIQRQADSMALNLFLVLSICAAFVLSYVNSAAFLTAYAMTLTALLLKGTVFLYCRSKF